MRLAGKIAVVTGAGAGFCSGADLVDSGRIPDIDGLTLPGISLRAMELLDDVILTLRKMHQPVIGAINGPAIGGGLCLSLAFDIRLAADGAYFRAAGINNGLSSAELGLSYLLPRAVGSSRAFEIMLTGRDVDAAEAARILAGFNDDQATDGPTAGPADLVGLKVAKERGWSAPEPGSAGDEAEERR